MGAITSAIILTAAAYFIAYALIRWLLKSVAFPCANLAAAWTILALCLRCVKSIAIRSEQLFNSTQALLASRGASVTLYLAIPILVFLIWRVRAILFMKRLTAALGFLPVIFILTAATWQTYQKIDKYDSVTVADIPAAAVASPTHDVILCFFDEWSYDRTFSNGVIRADMPNLQRLASGATVFHNARSAGSETHVSMPRFIFQRDSLYAQLPYEKLINQVYMQIKPNGPSIFANASNHFRAVLAFHVPYPSLIMDDLDYSIYVPFMESGISFTSRLEILLKSQLDFLHKASLLRRDAVDPLRQAGGAFRLRILVDQFENALRLPHVNLFVLAHFPIPHKPHIWDKGGLLENNFQRGDEDPLGYDGNLRYTDELIGRFVERLKRTGRYDTALIVLTSDHVWRLDPEKPPYDRIAIDREMNSPLRHVPLFIKFPGQEKGVTNNILTPTLSLYPLIASALENAKTSSVLSVK